MAPRSGLVVTVNPGASAFFAGEVFSATITFTNAYTPVDSSKPLISTSTPNLHASRNRPPSASQLPLADYAPSTLDAEAVPPSPAFGSTSGEWGRPVSGSSIASDSTVTSTRPSHSRRPSFASTASSGPTTPKASSLGFAAPPAPSSPVNFARSVSNFGTEPSKPALPTRKGLIGKPVPVVTAAERRPPTGLYGTKPRWPGAPGAHGRSQSMAVSNPDLPNGKYADRSVSAGNMPAPRAHGRSRLGGSIGGAAMQGPGLEERSRNSQMPVNREDPSSNYDDAAFPPSDASYSSELRHPSSSASARTHSGSYPIGPRQVSRPPNEDDSDDSDYDPADKQKAVPGHGFYALGQNETMDSIAHLDYEARRQKDPYAGLPRSVSSSIDGSGSRTQLHPPNTISLLWSFAHLEGTFEVDEMLIKTAEFMRLKRELMGGLSGVGGGTLDDQRQSSRAAGGGGWKSWLWGSGSAPAGGRGEVSGAASLEERRAVSMKEKNIPTFSSPPSILGVDLILEPGETKSYTFTIRVPADLPPSFRGKAIKFSYHLVVGTSRTELGSTAAPAASLRAARDATNRVMRVPVRMYNHVAVTGARPFYDLTNPVVYHRDEASVTEDGELPANSLKVVKKRARRPSNGRREFEDYASNLLDSVALSSPELPAKVSMSPELGTMRSPTGMEAQPSMRPERTSRSGAPRDAADDEEGTGCKSAVEIVTRNSQKVSYDINKDGYLVASLTLVKSAYRLGETVNGSLVINSGEGRVLRVSARLETHELIETSLSARSAPQIRHITRRLHAEHHESTLDSARVGFALAIPSGATPDFGTSGVKLQWSVRLSFLVIPPSPDAPTGDPNLTPRKPLGRQPPPPPPANGSSSANRSHVRSKSFAYGFEPAVPLTLPAPPMIAQSGAAHLMPSPRDGSAGHASYRAVPDLGFVPVMFTSAAPEPPPPPGPLQRSASGASLHRSSGSVSSPRAQSPLQQGSVVLVPAKVDTVECSIPIKVYPGNTPFRPTLSVFAA